MKITQRDKILLLLLLALLVVAIVIILPGVGVLACNEKVTTFKSQEKELDNKISERLNELYALGVDSNVAENASAAMDALEEKVLELEMEATRLAGSVMAYAKPYAIDESWVDGLEYRFGVRSDDSEKIVEYNLIGDVESSGNGNNKYFRVGENEYELPTASREIHYSTADEAECVYPTEYMLDGFNVDSLAATILFLQNITSKGSMLVTDLRYFTNEEQSHVVDFTLLMPPEGSSISKYATIVAEKLSKMAEEEDEEEED